MPATPATPLALPPPASNALVLAAVASAA
jgi:hypothetical protein